MTSSAAEHSLGAWLRRLPHYLYLVDLVPDKRVLEIGCRGGHGAQFLANHGAARVVGVDRSAPLVADARVRHRQTNLEFRCEEPGSIELDDASFDCIFVPEGIDILRRRSVLGELRRLLAVDGTLVLSGLSADRRGSTGGGSFHEFRDRLGRFFSPVRMVAQMPFAGFSLVEYGDEPAAPAIQLDTSLVELEGGASEATDYVAVCGGKPGALRAYVVVQLPCRAGSLAVASAAGVEIAGPDAAQTAEPARSVPPGDGTGDEVLARELRLRLETAIEDRARAEAEAEGVRSLADDLREEVDELRAAAVRGAESSAEERELAAVAGRLTASEQIAEALAAHRQSVRSLEVALEEGQAFAAELSSELELATARVEAERAAREAAEERAARFEAELRQWRSRAATSEGELIRMTRASEGGNGALVREAAAVPGAAGDLVARVSTERDELAARLAQAELALESVAEGEGRRGDALPAPPDWARRLARVDLELRSGGDLIAELERGLASLEQEVTREQAERAPSAWAAHRDQQLRELSSELGVKDAEIMILHVGVTALRVRVRELVGEVRRAAGSVRGRPAGEIIEVIDRLSARVAAFEERD